jgi:hypothetical protein
MKGTFHWSSGHAFYGSSFGEITSLDESLSKSGHDLLAFLNSNGSPPAFHEPGGALAARSTASGLDELLEKALLTAVTVMILALVLIGFAVVSWANRPRTDTVATQRASAGMVTPSSYNSSVY